MNYKDYENKMKYPKKPQRPGLKLNCTSKEARAYLNELKKYNTEFEEYQKHATAYRDENYRLEKLFKEDLFKEYGVSRNKKAEILYVKAYEKGHGEGYYNIQYYFGDLINLIKELGFNLSEGETNVFNT